MEPATEKDIDQPSSAFQSHELQSETAQAAENSIVTGADIGLKKRSGSSAKSGVRAPELWRRGQVFQSDDSLLLPSQVASTKQHQRSVDTMNVSPTAPNHEEMQRPAVELPATSVFSPDLPRTYFDSDSSSNSNTEEFTQEPIVTRASSVRAQKPHIIEHQVRRQGAGAQHPHIESPGLSTETDRPITTTQQGLYYSASKSQSVDQSTAGPGKSSSTASSESVNLHIEQPLPPVHTSPKALPPTPLVIRQSGIETPSTPIRAEALDTLPSPLGGFGSLPLLAKHSASGRPLRPPPRTPATIPTDGLRAHPINLHEITQLQRAISAPTLNSRHLNQRVTIRPSDLIVPDSLARRHRLFRESVVSTPYPTRDSSMAHNHSELLDQAITRTQAAQRATSSGEAQEKRKTQDRFPSPRRDEILFLELKLGGQSGAQVLVEIQINSDGTVDDQTLFQVTRNEYRTRLLGPARWFFTARRLSHVTFDGDGEFHPADFLEHLRSPKRGRGKKTWIGWLRRHQRVQGRRASGLDKLDSPAVSPLQTFTLPFVERRIGADTDPPGVQIFHEFSALRLVSAVGVVVTVSCMATVLWILFGVPGGHAGDREPAESEGLRRVGWRFGAERRVLPGLVLGILVFLLGSLGSMAWVTASFVLF